MLEIITLLAIPLLSGCNQIGGPWKACEEFAQKTVNCKFPGMDNEVRDMQKERLMNIIRDENGHHTESIIRGACRDSLANFTCQ